MKDKILEIAQKKIRKKGFNNFSYNDIVEELNISKAAVHYHFPKKIDLGLAYIQGSIDYTTNKLEIIIGQETDSKVKLENIFGIFRSMAEEEMFCPIGIIQAESNSLPEQMINLVKQAADNEIKLVKMILDEGFQKKDIQFEGNSETKAKLIISFLKGVLLNSLGGNQGYMDIFDNKFYLQLGIN